jgi:hypothetical protein
MLSDIMVTDENLQHFFHQMSILPYALRICVLRLWFHQRSPDLYLRDCHAQAWRQYEMFEKDR